MQRILLLVVAAFLTSACASVFKGTDQTLTFTSEPSGAEVLIDGISQGVTPTSVRLKKNKYTSILVKKKGYNTITRPLEKAYDGIALLNVVWDCSTTDFITGAVYEYQPSSYHFSLERPEAAETETKKSSKSE